ncbi:S24 family peptidase [Massilia aerilata]|uniref:S24 family peptidase n=1 Tax=Massilia aerilata TaxID=453817 RepID=A0ABW0RVJ1_9BURK
MHIQMKRLYEAAEVLAGLKTQSEIARALNTSSQTVNNWESRGMSKVGMLKAQSVFGCSATWLETGEGAMAVGPRSISNDDEGGFSPQATNPFLQGAKQVKVGEERDTVPIRRVSLKLRAGITGFETEPEFEDGGVLEIPRTVIDQQQLIPHLLLAIRVHGRSMEPMLFEDDTVVIDTNDTEPTSKELYALNFNGEACVKQLLLKGSEWFLHSLNPDFSQINVRSGVCSIVGRVIYQPGRLLTGRL